MGRKGKGRARLNVHAGASDIAVADLRNAIQAHPGRTAALFDEMIQRGVRLSDIRDTEALYNGLYGLQCDARAVIAGQVRTITTGAFPLLMGGLTVAAINDRMDELETVGDRLVEDIDDDSETTTIAGLLVTGPQSGERKTELEEYPDIGAGEERYDILSNDQGYKIGMSAKALRRGSAFDLQNKANALADFMAEDVEEQTLRRVTDHDGSASSGAEPYVLHLNKTGTALYSTTANTPGTRAPSGTRLTNTQLVDGTDLEAVRVRIAAMLNARGKRIGIPWSRVLILVPDALTGVLHSLVASDMIPGVENEVNPFGPRGKWRISAEQIVSTPKLDDLSTSAWYAGDFPGQFKRKWAVRMELVTLGTDTESYLRQGLAFQARISWDCEIGATDYNRVVQCLSGTTAPKDES